MVQEKTTWPFLQELMEEGSLLDWPDFTMQNIFNRNSAACGYHCLLYLLCKTIWPEEDMNAMLEQIYSKTELDMNDRIAVAFINKIC